MTSNHNRRPVWRRSSLPTLVAVFLALGLSVAACGSSDASDGKDGKDGSDSSSSDLSKQKLLTPDYSVDDDIRAMLPQSVQDAGVLKAALSTGNPPLTFPGATTDEVLGAVPDLQQAIEQIIGVKIEGPIYPSTAEQLLAIDSGRADIAFSTNSDTKEREANYDFVDYFKVEYRLIVQGDNVGKITKWQELCGTNYGSIKGSVDIVDDLNQACTDEDLPKTEVSYFEDFPAMVLAAKSGRIDTFFAPTTYAVWTDATGIKTSSVKPPTEKTSLFGFTVGKDNTGVSKAVLAALEKLVDDGYYEKVLKRWQLPEGAITPGINIGDQGSMFG